MKTFEFTVDGETQTTTEHTLKARQIISMVHTDPNSYYLIQIHGKDEESYENKPDEEIHIHEKAKFITMYTGETPVS